jgi:hypothetical protein
MTPLVEGMVSDKVHVVHVAGLDEVACVLDKRLDAVEDMVAVVHTPMTLHHGVGKGSVEEGGDGDDLGYVVGNAEDLP